MTHPRVDLGRVLQSVGLAVVATDRALVVSFANEAASVLLRTPAERLRGHPLSAALTGPDLSDLVTAAARVLADDAGQVLELTLDRPDGSSFDAHVRITPVLDDTGRSAGAVVVLEDVTSSRRAEAEGRAREQRLRLAHQAADLGTWHWDQVTGANYWDDRLQEIWGLKPGSFDGTFEGWSRTLHPEDVDAVLAVVSQAMAERSSYRIRHRILWPDGTGRTVESNGQVTTDAEGTATGTIGVVRDVTEEAQTARTLERAFADQRLAAARSEVLREITADFAAAATVEEVERALAGRLIEIESLLGGRARLALPNPITRVRAGQDFVRSGRKLTAEDDVLLDHLAAQVALAADRAHLLTRTSEISDHLQSSLAASPLPVVDGVELAVHYAPGGDELEHVGGDWYDVVHTPGGQVAVVLGDVMGRGVRAATTMIRVRAGIRGLLTVDPTPDVVLSRADRVVLRDAPDQFVTAVAVVVDPHRSRVRVCNAGHMPIVVAEAGGRVSAWSAGTGLPLGIVGDAPRASEDIDVPPGLTVVLVTDGVIERRDTDLEQSIADLVERVADLRDAPLPDLVDAVASMADPTLRDDVTVVAARVG